MFGTRRRAMLCVNYPLWDEEQTWQHRDYVASGGILPQISRESQFVCLLYHLNLQVIC